MRNYYYERDNRDEFVRNCNEIRSNVEFNCHGTWVQDRNRNIAIPLDETDEMEYRCYVDIPDETKGN